MSEKKKMCGNANTKKPKLWTKNFSILILGSYVSLLGNSVSGYIISLMIYDMTQSVFLFSVFTVSFYLPKMLVSMFAGAYMDRFSRKKVIYTLDFISASLYSVIFVIIFTGLTYYWLFLILVLIVGCINGVYEVAFNSLFPNIVERESYTKGYAVSSMIQPLALCMIPVASVIYYNFGSAAPLFVFNACAFLTAAIFETRIDFDESYIINEKVRTPKEYRQDIKEGFKYTVGDRGLLAITVYFAIMNFASGGYGALALPFFKSHPEHFNMTGADVVTGASVSFESLTEFFRSIVHYFSSDTATLYTFVMAFGVVGRLVGGWIQYRLKYNPKKRFVVAVVCCTAIAILDMTMLFFPVWGIALACMMTGLLSIAVNNIRLSTTQAYVPDKLRARFVSLFEMMFAAGNITGQLMGGVLGEFLPERGVIALFNVINIVAIYAVLVANASYVKRIFNMKITRSLPSDKQKFKV